MIELNRKEKALLVTVDVFSQRTKGISLEDEANELRELTKTAALEAAQEEICRVDTPSPNLFIGTGKAWELSLLVSEHNIDAAIFSTDLSGTQARNLEEKLGCKIIDRTQLILDIFAQHARGPEGKMQVELAQLEYLLPRLTGKGTMLSRMGGGIGARGPGEQKLELDRRIIRNRIGKLKRELAKARAQRDLLRKKRKTEKIPLVSLVGYTNAGKTTLLNSLVNEHQLADDSLFTTLDPLSRILILPNRQKIILSDTVGFLHNLPHHLIEAFKATLEDVREADLLIHVLDVSHPLRYSYYESVNQALLELECQGKNIITALNKIDKLEDQSWIERYKQDFPESLVISGLKKENLEQLLAAISQKVAKTMERVELTIPLDKMGLVDMIYKEGKVEKARYTSKSVIINAFLPVAMTKKLSEFSKKEI